MSDFALRVFRCRMPDGHEHVQKLPRYSRLRLGAKCNVALVFKQHLIVVWFERVKNGWALLQPQPSSTQQPKAKS